MKKETGFTLIELMMVLALMAIVSAYAVPSMTQIIKNNRLTTQTNLFISAMQLARSEAIKRGESITVSATGGIWNDGWTVQTATPATIKTFGAVPKAVTIASTGTFVSYTYDSQGLVDHADTLTVCDDRTAETGRLISLTITGRVSVANSVCP